MTPAERRRMPRALRVTAGIGITVLALALCLAVAALVVVLSPPLATPVVRWALGRVELLPGANLRLGRLDIGAAGTVHLGGARLADGAGTPIAEIRAASAWLAFPKLLRGRVVLDSLVVVEPRIDLGALRDALPHGPAAQPPPEGEDRGHGADIAIAVIRITGGELTGVRWGGGTPREITVRGIELRARNAGTLPEIHGELDELAARIESVGGEQSLALRASGRAAAGRAQLALLRIESETTHIEARGHAPILRGVDSLLTDLALEIDAEPMAAADLGLFFDVPPGTSSIRLGLDIDLHGPARTTPSGTAMLNVAPLRWGEHAIDAVRIDSRWDAGDARFTAQAGIGEHSVKVSGQLRPLAEPMPFALDLEAKSGRLSASGEIAWQDGPRYQVHNGRIRDLDLAKLLPGAPPTRLDATLSAYGRGFDPSSLAASVDLAFTHAEVAGRDLGVLEAAAGLDAGRATLRADARTAGGDAFVEAALQLQGEAPAVESGVVRFARVNLAHWAPGSPPSDLTGRITLDRFETGATQRVTGRVQLGPSACGDESIASADLGFGVSAASASLTGDVQTAHGALAIDAEARLSGAASPAAVIRDLRFTHIDPGAWLAKPALHMDLSGSIAGELSGRWPGTLAARAEVALDSSTIRSQRIDRVHASATVEGHTIMVRGNLHAADASANLALDGTVVEGAAAAGASPRDGWQVDAVVQANGAWRGVRVDTLEAAVRAGAARVQVDGLRLRSNVATLDGGGAIATRDWIPAAGETLTVRGVVHQSSVLDSLTSRPLGWDEFPVALSLRGSGEGEAEVTAFARAGEVTVDAARAAALEVEAHGRVGSRLRPLSGSASLRADSLFAAGRLIPLAEIRVTPVDSAALRVGAGAVLASGERLRIAAHGEPRFPGTGVIDTLELDAAGESWRLAHPVAVTYGRRVEIEDLRLASATQSLHVNGILDPDSEQTMRVQASGVRIETITALVGMPSLRGRIDLEAAATGAGTATAVAADIRAQLESDASAVKAVARVAHRHSGCVVDAWIGGGSSDSLVARAELPPFLPGGFAPDPRPKLEMSAVEFSLQARDFDLATLKPLLPKRTLRTLAGRLDAQLRLDDGGGRRGLRGSLALRDGTLELTALGTPYEQVRLQATIAPESLHVAELSANSHRGTLRASGTLGQGSGGGAVTLAAQLDRFRVMHTPALHIVASGGLRVEGTVQAPAITGKLTLTETDIDISGQGPGSAGTVELEPEDWAMLERHFGHRRSAPAAASAPLFERTAMHVKVTAGTDTWLRRRANPRLAIELDGEVDVRKEPAGPVQVFGRIEPLPKRSSVEQFGRSFTLERGSVVANGDPANAQVDLRAKYEVASAANPSDADVTVKIAVTGPADKLEVKLTSDPPMGESELLSTLLTGRAPAAAGAGTSDGGAKETTAGIAIGQASAIIEGLGSEVGLDVLEVRPDGVHGATIVAGSYVRPGTFLGVRQQALFQSERDEASSEGQSTEVEVEHELLDWLLINLQGGTSSARVYLRSRYSY